MADADGESVRRLIRTPKEQPFPIPKDERVSITPESQFSRWYENSGGFDKAVRQAQLAQVERSIRGDDGDYPFLDWNAKALSRPIPSAFGDSSHLAHYSHGTKYQQPSITIRDNLDISNGGSQFILDHELGHGVYVENNGDFEAPRNAVPMPEGTLPSGVNRKNASYYRKPSEIDTRLGTIKRAYAFNTGKLPETPEDSEKALQWYIDNWEAPAGTDDAPEQMRDSARVYMGMPSDQKKQVLRRMLEVVSDPRANSLIARLGPQA
jgi:hypothetical protein